jgi:hypothetical protein
MGKPSTSPTMSSSPVGFMGARREQHVCPGRAGKTVMRSMPWARASLPSSARRRRLRRGDSRPKPFHFGELLARVRALTRRRALPILPERLVCGRPALNTRTQEAWIDGRPIELTAREYALLEYLCRKHGAAMRPMLAQTHTCVKTNSRARRTPTGTADSGVFERRPHGTRVALAARVTDREAAEGARRDR